jgi:ABC-type Na+ efflux pump permease subunit
MGAIAAAIALSQYAALLTAIGALARLSVLLAVRGVELWQEEGVGPEQRVL